MNTPDTTNATPRTINLRACANELNAAFNLYAWADCIAECEAIVAKHTDPLEAENARLREALSAVLTARAVETLLIRTAGKHPDTVDDEDAELMNAAGLARGVLNRE